MKKSSPASISKNSALSAWAKGPPQKPAPNNTASPTSTTTHSRRPCNFAQSVDIEEGVSVPQGHVGSLRQGSAVTFGSINDASAPVSFSPSATLTINNESMDSFRSAPISPIPSAAAVPFATKPATVKIDLQTLFQSARSLQASSQPNFDPLLSSAQLSNISPQFQQHPSQPYLPAHQPHSLTQPSQFRAHAFTPYARPGGGIRPQRNEVGISNVSSLPVYPTAQDIELGNASPAVTAPQRGRTSPKAFVPGTRSKVIIRDLNGVEVSLDDLKKRGTASSGSPGRAEVETKKMRLKEKRRLKREAEELHRIVGTLRIEAEEESLRKTQEDGQKVKISSLPVYTSIGTEVDPVGIDISTTSPLFHGRPRPGPPAMSSSRKDVLVSLPSVYATAQFIQDLGQIKYPDGIKSPDVELNVNAKDGKYRYDRDFLLQFMPLCKEKPNTIPLYPLGLTPIDQNLLTAARDDSGRHRPTWGTQSKQGEEGNAANKAMRSKRTRSKRGEKPAVHPTRIALDSAPTISSPSARSDMFFDSVVPLELKF